MRGMLTLGVPIGGGTTATVYDELLSQFVGTGQAGIYRMDSAGAPGVARYNLLYKTGGGYYLQRLLVGGDNIGDNHLRISRTALVKLHAWVNDNDANLVKSGTWLRNTPLYWGGGYSRSDTAGAYIEYTTRDEVTEIGIWGVPAGVHLITIDGDMALANLMGTAQDEVDAERLPDTVLVANGGTLNPTDKVWNSFARGNSHHLLADGLTPGVHTLRLTRTGYKQAAASTTWLAIAAFSCWGSNMAFDVASDAYFFAVEEQAICVLDPASDEMSYIHQPTGTTAAEWLGHTSSLKMKTVRTITVDGAEIAPTNFTSADPVPITVGTTIEISFSCDGRHSELVETNTALVEFKHRAHATRGLEIWHRTTWLTAGTTTGYPAMLTLNPAYFDRARAFDGTDVALSQTTDYVAKTSSKALMAWKSDGNIGALFYIPDLKMTVNDWLDAGTEHLWISDGSLQKIYAQKVLSYTYAQNEAWESEFNMRFAWFSDGANGALSVPSA